jgi:hypothetical protein
MQIQQLQQQRLGTRGMRQGTTMHHVWPKREQQQQQQHKLLKDL